MTIWCANHYKELALGIVQIFTLKKEIKKERKKEINKERKNLVFRKNVYPNCAALFCSNIRRTS